MPGVLPRAAKRRRATAGDQKSDRPKDYRTALSVPIPWPALVWRWKPPSFGYSAPGVGPPFKIGVSRSTLTLAETRRLQLDGLIGGIRISTATGINV